MSRARVLPRRVGRSLGRHPITVRIDRDGYLSRIELAGPRVVARAIE
jgi:hypothetical protein